MAYDKQNWINGAGGATPLSAARMNHIEDGLESLNNDIAALSLGGLTPSDILAGSNVTVVQNGDGTVTISSTATGGGGGGLEGYFNVKDYGAVGNGTNDDTAAINSAIAAAGVGGIVYFPKTSSYYRISSSLKPLERQTWIGSHSPMYDWDEYVNQNGAIRAASSFTGTALIKNTATIAKGVTLRNLCLLGNGEAGTLNGIDFGPGPDSNGSGSGGERAWMLQQVQLNAFGGAALCGHMWVTDLRDVHISRCGYGIRPTSGDTSGGTRFPSAWDCRWTGMQIYFTYHSGIALTQTGSYRAGGVTITNSRIERCGTQVSPFDPDINRDSNAAGILITAGQAIQISDCYTDANSGPGLALEAASLGDISGIKTKGNIWKRDGTGNNSSTMYPGVRVRNTIFVSMVGDHVTFGDPDDGDNLGRIAPQYGVEMDTNQFFKWDGTVELQTDALTRSNGYRYVGTAPWMSQVFDPRQGILQLPRSDSAPLNPQKGFIYYDNPTNKLRFYNGTVWETITSA